MGGRLPTDGFSPEALNTLRTVFFQECEENLAELETGLLALQAGSADWEIINSVFRAAHSIKGGAGVFALDRLVAFAHEFESVLSELRAARIEATDAVLKTMLRAADVLADLVRAARDGGAVDERRIAPVEAELVALSGRAPASAALDDFPDFAFTPQPVAFIELDDDGPLLRRWKIRFKPFADLYAKANEPLVLLRELRGLGDVEVELDDGDLPPLNELEPEEGYLAWNIILTTSFDPAHIREVFEFVDGDCELTISEDAPAAPSLADLSFEDVVVAAAPVEIAKPITPAAPPTIRVDLERVDRLIDLVSELVINQAMLYQRVADHGLASTSSVGVALDDLDHITRDIQDNVMSIRAQPVKTVFQRLSRLVREVEAATGKQVRLVTEGEATEVDRTVIERLTDPLTHMIRNAVDHGIETAEGRRRAGKSPQGVVRIAAAHRGGRIVIDVSDDGAGISRARVRAKAVERGLIAADAALSDEEIDNLIFAPGFSTVEEVSDLSGRGVGMDVVKRSVEALGGRLSLSSRLGEGTTFSLSLPLTLAVLDGMVVTAGGQTLVAPLTTLLETVQPKPEFVRHLGPNALLLSVRGAHVPLIDLGVSLGYHQSTLPLAERVALLVENDEGERMALLVDDIIGQRQVVIKSLESNYRRVPGVAAATILGDGRVALILDVNAVIASRQRVPGAHDSEAA